MLHVLINILAIIGGLITIYEFADKFPWVLYLYAPVLLIAIVLPIWRRLFGYWIIRRDLSLAEDLLRTRGITPTAIIAFDRSSAIFAGMLAQRIGIGEVLAVPRISSVTTAAGEPRRIVVGSRLKLDWGEINISRALVLVFHLRTGATLDAGMRFLKRQDVDFKGHIIALYATKGGIARWPGALCVHTISHDFVPNENFPWMSGKYRHL